MNINEIIEDLNKVIDFKTSIDKNLKVLANQVQNSDNCEINYEYADYYKQITENDRNEMFMIENEYNAYNSLRDVNCLKDLTLYIVEILNNEKENLTANSVRQYVNQINESLLIGDKKLILDYINVNRSLNNTSVVFLKMLKNDFVAKVQNQVDLGFGK